MHEVDFLTQISTSSWPADNGCASTKVQESCPSLLHKIQIYKLTMSRHSTTFGIGMHELDQAVVVPPGYLLYFGSQVSKCHQLDMLGKTY